MRADDRPASTAIAAYLGWIPARDGRAWHVDAGGNYWRAYHFIDNARSYDIVQSPEQAHQAARAFGHFQQMLVNLPAAASGLAETILDFHHTPKRFAALERAIEADVANRAVLAKPEIEFALARRSMVSALIDAKFARARDPDNDTKF